MPYVDRHGIPEDQWRKIAYYAYQQRFETKDQSMKEFEEIDLPKFDYGEYQWFYKMWLQEQRKMGIAAPTDTATAKAIPATKAKATPAAIPVISDGSVNPFDPAVVRQAMSAKDDWEDDEDEIGDASSDSLAAGNEPDGIVQRRGPEYFGEKIERERQIQIKFWQELEQSSEKHAYDPILQDYGGCTMDILQEKIEAYINDPENDFDLDDVQGDNLMGLDGDLLCLEMGRECPPPLRKVVAYWKFATRNQAGTDSIEFGEFYAKFTDACYGYTVKNYISYVTGMIVCRLSGKTFVSVIRKYTIRR